MAWYLCAAFSLCLFCRLKESSLFGTQFLQNLHAFQSRINLPCCITSHWPQADFSPAERPLFSLDAGRGANPLQRGSSRRDLHRCPQRLQLRPLHDHGRKHHFCGQCQSGQTAAELGRGTPIVFCKSDSPEKTNLHQTHQNTTENISVSSRSDNKLTTSTCT